MNLDDLKPLPLFEKLDKSQLGRLARWVDDVDVPAGREIVPQDSLAWEFFVIIDGEASVEKDGAHLTDLGPGDFFGEMALVAHEPRSASVVAKTDMRLGVMIERDFHEMEEEMPEVARKIRDAIEERKNRT
jgi:CRP-like cAMP-binding protein